MTFLHKLARRLSVIRALPLVGILLVGCSPSEERDFLSPNPGQPSAELATITVSPKAGTVKPNETISFSATGTSISGKTVPAEVTWEATGGTITADGVFTSDQYGQFKVTARARTAPHISDAATVAVFVSPKDILLVRVSPDSAVITEGEGLQLAAEVQLADGTQLRDPPLDWNSTGGYVDGSGWFSGATQEGVYLVNAKSSNGVGGNSKVIVRAGKRVLEGLDVSPATVTLTAGQTVAFVVTGVWNDGSDKPPAVVWSATGGSIDGSGIFTAGSTAGNYLVIARDKFSTLADTARISVTEPVITSLEVSPGSSALAPGAVEQFVATARMSDGSSKTVGASWQATGGTISAGGLYTASPTAGSYQVVGKIAGTTLADTAAVAVAQPVATVTQLILNPSSASVPAGATRQFSASATWSDGSTQAPAVNWSATGGSVSAGGLFTAGTVQGSYRVIATEAGGKADTSAVTVAPPALTELVLNPSTASLLAGESRQFSVSGSWTDGSTAAPSVTWTVAGGTITSSGLFTAGTAAGTYRIVATQQGGTLADTSFVTVAEPTPVLTSLAVSPASVTLAPGGVQRFSASATWSNGGTSLPPLTWSATGGTIGTDGTFTAGSQTGSFRVIVTEPASGLADTSAVTVSQAAPTLTSMVLSPASTSLQPGGSRQFYLSATWSDGSTAVPSVTWTATGGTVTNGGLYVAGQTAGSYRVVATQAGGSVADTAEVTVSTPVTLVGLTVSPDSQVVPPGQAVQYSATGLYSNGGSGTPSVTWSATGGTISSSGSYLAGTAAGGFRVMATSGAVADTASVLVDAATVASFRITPDSATLAPGASQQFSAQVTWSDGQTHPAQITWTATGGGITVAGMYTAGSLLGPFMVAASCSCGAADTAMVAVATAPAQLVSLSVSPDTARLSPGGTQRFTATAQWSDGSSSPVSASFSAAGGTIDTAGVFTAGGTPGTYPIVATQASSGAADTAWAAVLDPGLDPGTSPTVEPELPRATVNIAYPTLAGRQIRVAAGSSLQSAINSAACGDEILLTAGASYEGSFSLPAKGCSSWIVIRTETALPPQGTRVTPGTAVGFAKLVSPGSNLPALLTAARASYFRIVGVEITARSDVSSLNTLVKLGSGGSDQNSLDLVPDNIILDRVYVHGSATMALTRCVQLHSATTAIVDSWLADCHASGFDSQAIVGWNGPGPYKIANNYLEGAGENVMFGGATPAIQGLLPSDIEISRNHFIKPIAWRNVWSAKNLLEIKFGVRVLIEGNVFENSWRDAQTGNALLIKSVNSGGMPWANTRDITVRYNVIRNAEEGGIALAAMPEQQAIPVSLVSISHNLIYRLGPESDFGGNGKAFTVLGTSSSGINHLHVVHNTVLSYHSALLLASDLSPPLAGDLVYSGNLAAHGQYGISGSGGTGMVTVTNRYSTYSVESNVFFAGSRYAQSAYPASTRYSSTIEGVGFVNPAGADFRLRTDSQFKGSGPGGTDPGADFARLNELTANVVVR